MEEQKKISTRKVVRFSVGALLAAIFLVALAAASSRQSDKAIRGLEVHLNDDKEYSFLQRKDIEKLLLGNRHINLARTSISKLDLKLMEDIARTNPWVSRADIFVDNRQVLRVNITQREPMARIFDVNGGSYYMDSTLHTMPASGGGYAYAAPVFTNVPVLRNDSMDRSLKGKIAYLSNIIGKDSFWQAQITQVEVQPDQTFVLIPLLGNQRILAGDTSNMPEKLAHLLAFYKNVSGRIGWDKYETLDIRFRDQVIASPSIGWVPPKIADTVSPLPAAAPVSGNTAAAATTHSAPKPAAPAARAKPAVKPPAVKKADAAKRKPAAEKPKPVVQAARKPQPKKEAKKDTKNSKTNTNVQSPKYIYPGKQTGNR